ncbi:MAG: DUF4276 family protein [Acidobacteriota bacterium]
MKVRLYVEGGPKGVHADGLRRFKSGFKQHLGRLDPRLSNIEISPCGSTVETIRDFARAARQCGDDCIVALLVDADAPVVKESPARHLADKLSAANIPREHQTNIFLMVQCMEAWLLIDRRALEKCYGRTARDAKLPSTLDIETITARDLVALLDAMAKGTATGKYHKVRDAARILTELNPEIVAQRSRHARELHQFLRQSVEQ